MSMTMAANREPRKITGKTVILGMLAFYGVIIGVNSLFVFFALDTWPGLTTEDSYKKGLAYNQTIDAAAKQSALGWQSNLVVSDAASPDKSPDKSIVIKLTKDAGTSIGGLVVTVTMERAVGAHETQIVALSQNASGDYVGVFKAPKQGRWIADIKAVGANNASYRMKHQVMITP